MSQDHTTDTADIEHAIQEAFCRRHACVGMAGAALSARYSLAISCVEGTGGFRPEQASRLRAWADVMLDAAKRLETAK
jgi:hypothetical protein